LCSARASTRSTSGQGASPAPGERHRRVVGDLAEQLLRLDREVEVVPPGEQQVQQCPDRVLLARRAGGRRRLLLPDRVRVLRLEEEADARSVRRLPIGRRGVELGLAEIDQLDPTLLIHQDVVRVDVAVDDLARVQPGVRLRDGTSEGEQLRTGVGCFQTAQLLGRHRGVHPRNPLQEKVRSALVRPLGQQRRAASCGTGFQSCRARDRIGIRSHGN
jgi:hypothetical protein